MKARCQLPPHRGHRLPVRRGLRQWLHQYFGVSEPSSRGARAGGARWAPVPLVLRSASLPSGTLVIPSFKEPRGAARRLLLEKGSEAILPWVGVRRPHCVGRRPLVKSPPPPPCLAFFSQAGWGGPWDFLCRWSLCGGAVGGRGVSQGQASGPGRGRLCGSGRNRGGGDGERGGPGSPGPSSYEPAAPLEGRTFSSRALSCPVPCLWSLFPGLSFQASPGPARGPLLPASLPGNFLRSSSERPWVPGPRISGALAAVV